MSACETEWPDKGSLLNGVVICRELLVIVILLLFSRVNVGVDNEECNGDETSRTVCGDCRIKFPALVVVTG